MMLVQARRNDWKVGWDIPTTYMVGMNMRSGWKRVKVAAKRWLKLFPTVPLYSFGHAVRLGGAHGINRTTHKFNLLRPLRDKNLAVVCWTDSAVYANQVIFFSTCAAAQPVHSVYCGRAHTARRGTATPRPTTTTTWSCGVNFPKKKLHLPRRTGRAQGRALYLYYKDGWHK